MLDDQDIFREKTSNVYNEGKNLFSNDTKSWKNKAPKSSNKNLIPPSIDVPPPISTICKLLY